ncbi:hypothetical protein ABB37_00450 [Leptomonas pyrrhocoris]|uniref:Uncharacterized protein n=1 Tax=Leptomonas pyrrhocoris TaxID=157538 RepID=A0A0M9GAC1_LEPPY|nr:hypothetical protein ABB37_00450 [Leptomonas pyrrhocoris]KPA86210.1 hypothetical protein ABB37_00450 [Leptomonas pyrrhocoris]|eukprot:XP_015664649.1 hypothetical protein ABB37_00450 [Leptomonas pyrrhocoris]
MSATEMSNGSKAAANEVRLDSSGDSPDSVAANGSKKRSTNGRGDGRPGSGLKSSTTGAAANAFGEVVRMTSVQTVTIGDGSGTAAETRSSSSSSSSSNGGSASPAAASATAVNATPSKTTIVPYPAPSVGLSAPTTFATSLLNLEVKVLTQALGAENQWVEQGDGRVSFCDFTIRVTAPKPSTEGTLKDKRLSGNPNGFLSGSTEAESSASSVKSQEVVKGTSSAGETRSATSTVSDLDEDEEDEAVILEDTISNDTPFVGENCCIVWNSFEKQLSLCLMYASEEGYSASWSALVALQDKSYPPFRYDLLERCCPASERTVLTVPDSESSVTPIPSSSDKADGPVLPYAYFIHERHDPPLGFIEQHALSLSIIEHHHASNPALYENKDTVVAMLSVANADLLDHLISDQNFPLLLSGLKCTANSLEWVVPAQLRELHVPPDVTASIAKDRRITFLQESVLPTCCSGETKTELMTKYSTLSRRIRNDIVCGLLTCDALFTEASEALRIAPPAVVNGTASTKSVHNSPGAMALSRINSIDSSANLSNGSLSSDASPKTTSLAGDAVIQVQKAEQQVLAHLRFFRELVTLSISELGREMVGPIVGKVYQCGLLYSLSLVAERFAMPANVATVFVKRLTENNNGGLGSNRRGGGAAVVTSGGNSHATSNGTNFYSPAVEQELAALLDVTLVRINERQEEQLMNDHVRAPILADPLKYNGLVTFMVRQLVVNGAATGSAPSTGTTRAASGGGMLPQPKRIMRDSMSATNPFALFHVLGLHDDEGSAASERVLDAESTYVRNQFHNFIITKYLAHATRGTMPPVPLPPSLGGVAARNTPIVRFDNAAAAQSGGVRSAHHDSGESSTSTTTLGVPNTGVGVGAGSAGSSGGGNSSNGGGGANGGGSPSTSPVLPLPQGVTPALIRVLEYLVALASRPNRELLLKTVFHPKSHILHFIEGACDTLCCTDGIGGRCQVGLDVLCGCVRFLKVVITQMALPSAEQDENPLSSYAASPEPLSSTQTTAICRQLTVERDTFGYLLKAYNKLGGLRRNTVFHSSLLAVLDIISKCPSKEAEDRSTNNLRDLRDYLFYKHLTRLPEVFARRFREQLLDEASRRLGREASHSPNDSVSVLSSTIGSELLRSSSKLRFVDEVEAAAGGVDGTVVPGSVMNPAIAANVASAEEKQRKRNARSTLDQWTATATHVMSSQSPVRAVASLGLSDENASRSAANASPPPPSSAGARASPPLTINISRPGSTSAGGSRTLSGDAANSNPATTNGSSPPPPSSVEVTAAAPSHLTSGAHAPDNSGAPSTTTSSGTAVLKPTAPKNEKPPGRPRNFASVLETTAKNTENGTGKSRSMPNITTGALSPPPSPEETRLAKSGTITTSVPPPRTNSPDENGAVNHGSPLSPADNVILPKIKKRASASGKRL